MIQREKRSHFVRPEGIPSFHQEDQMLLEKRSHFVGEHKEIWWDAGQICILKAEYNYTYTLCKQNGKFGRISFQADEVTSSEVYI